MTTRSMHRHPVHRLAVLTLCLVANAFVTSVAEPQDQPRNDNETGISFSSIAEPPRELSLWHQAFLAEFAPVEVAWARLLQRMAGDRPRLFEAQCDGLNDSLDAVDGAILLPVPDTLIDLYLRQLLNHLDEASRACERDELFNVAYRLEEARSRLAEIRWLFEIRGLPR